MAEEQRNRQRWLDVLEQVSSGEMPPQEFSRPEVAQILIDAYRTPAAAR